MGLVKMLASSSGQAGKKISLLSPANRLSLLSGIDPVNKDWPIEEFA